MGTRAYERSTKLKIFAIFSFQDKCICFHHFSTKLSTGETGVETGHFIVLKKILSYRGRMGKYISLNSTQYTFYVTKISIGRPSINVLNLIRICPMLWKCIKNNKQTNKQTNKVISFWSLSNCCHNPNAILTEQVMVKYVGLHLILNTFSGI
jgi:hypothetical protein